VRSVELRQGFPFLCINSLSLLAWGISAFDFSLSDRYLVADHDERHPKLRRRFSLGIDPKQGQHTMEQRNATGFDKQCNSLTLWRDFTPKEWNISCSDGAE
jgi:hypothetical protein